MVPFASLRVTSAPAGSRSPARMPASEAMSSAAIPMTATPTRSVSTSPIIPINGGPASNPA
jgi:hypothetical protein